MFPCLMGHVSWRLYKQHYASAKAASWVAGICDGGGLYICVWGGGRGFLGPREDVGRGRRWARRRKGLGECGIWVMGC